MQTYSVRDAKADEQRELTRLCVRATLQTGYDEAFVQSDARAYDDVAFDYRRLRPGVLGGQHQLRPR